MAVYTEVPDEELARFIARYPIGPLLSCKGIAEGVENSNYLLHAGNGHYILTLYERRVERADLPFFLGLMEHLAGGGLTCPLPVHDEDGEALGELCGRPAAIFTFLDGMSIRRPRASHCAAVGRALAHLHEAGRNFPLHRANALSVRQWRALAATAGAAADKIIPGIAAALTEHLDALERGWPQDLPAGVIHADLFPDNVFFLGEKLSGLIDFYFACNDLLAYDLAICLNAWCFEPDAAFNVTKGRALIAGYHAVRPLGGAEIAALPLLARGAAMRFLLTRLVDWLAVRPGALVQPKDPMEYWKKLRFHADARSAADYGWTPP
jgi:homoserine kinase type II